MRQKTRTAVEFGKHLKSLWAQNGTHNRVFPKEFLYEMADCEVNGYSHRSRFSLHGIFPELADTIHQDGGHHHNETVFQHLVDAFQLAIDREYSWTTCLAALLHDIGKPQTAETIISPDKVQIKFHKHEHVGALMAYRIVMRFYENHKLAKRVESLVLHHMFYFESLKDKPLSKWLYRVGKDWEELLKIRLVDRASNRANKSKPEKTREYKQLEKAIVSLLQRSVVMPDQLNVSKEWLNEIIPESERNYVLTNVIGQLKQNPELNEEDWIRKAVLRSLSPKTKRRDYFAGKLKEKHGVQNFTHSV